MCGRYASSKSAQDLALEFEVEELGLATLLPASFNVAPTDEVYVVVERPAPAEGDRRVRQLRAARWGLIPSWAKDRSAAARMINARLETAAEKPAFRKAFAARRCLVPADGYFEWYQERPGAKQPYFLRSPGGGSLAMAGLYEIWRDPAAPSGQEPAFVWSCSILTTSATDRLGRIHDRMPVMIEPEGWSTWLGPEAGSLDLVEATRVHDPALEAFPVSAAVGNVRNNSPELVAPIGEAALL